MNEKWESESLPFVFKAAAMLLVGLFVVIGIIGLVLPIIPGIVFLTLAALLLAKVSSRFAQFLEDQPLWHKLRRNWRSVRVLSVGQRIKLMALYCARSTVDAMESLIRVLQR